MQFTEQRTDLFYTKFKTRFGVFHYKKDTQKPINRQKKEKHKKTTFFFMVFTPTKPNQNHNKPTRKATRNQKHTIKAPRTQKNEYSGSCRRLGLQIFGFQFSVYSFYQFPIAEKASDLIILFSVSVYYSWRWFLVFVGYSQS